MAKLLTRADIFQRTELPKLEVEVPEWGGSVLIRTLSAREADQFEADSIEFGSGGAKANLDNVRARFVALAVCDERGEPIFSADDVAQLGDLSTVALQRVFEAAQRHNGMDRASKEAIRKKSETPSG